MKIKKYKITGCHRMVTALLLFSMLISSCAAPTFRTFDKPIVFDKERKELSLEYLEERYGIQQDAPFIIPKMVVIHWTAIPTLEQSFNAMKPSRLPGSREKIETASSLNVSTQYLVDRDGTIFKLLPETAFARHVIGLNHCAIGIENVGGSDAPLTRAQLKANEALIRYLSGRYDIEYVIGHHEYQNFVGHPLWKEKDENYRTIKIDPGSSFMTKIRKRLDDLNLKGAPQAGLYR